MGGGIVALHYIAMDSMRSPAMCHYSPAWVTLSVAVAIAGSLLALRSCLKRACGTKIAQTGGRPADGRGNRRYALYRDGRGHFYVVETAPDLSYAVSRTALGVAPNGRCPADGTWDCRPDHDG